MRRRVSAEEHMGELNIVPYLDVVVNLVMFMLLSMTGLISLGVLNVSAPKATTETTAAAPENTPKLTLTVAVTPKGFFVMGAEGILGADAAANEAQRPPTVPLKKNEKGELVYDYAGLTAELAKVKAKFPNESQVILSADWEIAYDTLVQTMDACREQTVTGADGKIEKKKMFFDVSLSQPIG
jgi:biopolymer transport protein ExbD